MIRILLCGEGPTDQGRKDFIDSEYVNSDGVLQILIKKVSKIDNLTFVTKTRQELKNTVKFHKRYYSKQEANSRKILIAANKENCTHIAYHRDEDNKGLKEIHQQAQGYFEDAKKKGINCIAIIPMHMTESWLLADKNAFPTAPKNPALPAKPKETWGNKGTDSHPKKYLERILAQFPQYKNRTLSDVYAEIAENSDIEILRQRCPESFDRKFCSDMQSFIIQEAGAS
jgi:hypothetical protein